MRKSPNHTETDLGDNPMSPYFDYSLFSWTLSCNLKQNVYTVLEVIYEVIEMNFVKYFLGYFAPSEYLTNE